MANLFLVEFFAKNSKEERLLFKGVIRAETVAEAEATAYDVAWTESFSNIGYEPAYKVEIYPGGYYKNTEAFWAMDSNVICYIPNPKAGEKAYSAKDLFYLCDSDWELAQAIFKVSNGNDVEAVIEMDKDSSSLVADFI